MRLPTGYATMPTIIDLHLTFRCNLKCHQCISLTQPITKEQELTIEEWKDVFRQCADFNPIIYITGGEPLIVPGIKDLLRYGKSIGVKLHLQTNGVLLSRFAESLVDIGIDHLTVSLDGPPEVHDSIRGIPDAFEKSAQGLRDLLAARAAKGKKLPFVDINSCMIAPNIKHLLEMPKIAREIGVDYLQFQHPIFNSRKNVDRHNAIWTEKYVRDNQLDVSQRHINDTEFYENEITPELLDQTFLPNLAELREQAKNGANIGFFPNVPVELTRAYYTDMSYPFPQTCASTWGYMHIMPNGSVEPCLHVHMGNVKDTPLKDIWNSKQYKLFRMLLKKGLWPGCARCCFRVYA